MHREVKFRLTKSQIEKIHSAKSSGRSVKLRLSISQMHPSGTPLLLTEKEISRLNDGRVHDITITSTRLNKMGGILPLLPLLAGLGALATVSGGVAGTVAGVKSSQKADAERKAAAAAEELARYRLQKEMAADKKGGFLPLIPLLALAGAGAAGAAAAASRHKK